MPGVLEYNYNGVTVGGSLTDYPVTNVEGLSGIDIRTAITDKALDHGSYINADYLPERRITLEGYVPGADPTDLRVKLDPLRAAYVPQRNDLPFTFRMPGDIDKLIYCKPEKSVTYPVNVDYTLGFANWALQLVAGNPRIYDAAEQEEVFSGTQILNNAGDFPTNPVIEFANAVNPSIVNNDTGDSLVFVGSGANWQINFENRVVLVAGVSSYSLLDLNASSWWSLGSGDTSITINGGDGTVRWRSAWIGV